MTNTRTTLIYWNRSTGRWITTTAPATSTAAVANRRMGYPTILASEAPDHPPTAADWAAVEVAGGKWWHDDRAKV
jgi:hypothetical protein